MNAQRTCLAFFLLALGAACGENFEPAAPDQDGGSGASGSSGTHGGAGGSAASGGTGASGGAGTGGSGGSAGDGGPQCPGTHRCIPAVPTGWEGPIANAFDAECAGAWPGEALVVHTDLKAPEATCECKCTAKTNCPATLSFVSSSSSGCSLSGSGTALSSGTCKNASGLPTNGIKLAPATPGCASAVTETIPPTSWTTTHHLCSGAIPGGECANSNEVCLPNPGVALCVYRQGDVTCPAGYTDKHSYFSGISDTRDCPATCTCTPGGFAQCLSTITTYGSSDCQGTYSTFTVYSGATGTCFTSSAVAGAIVASQAGTCAPETLSPTGSVEPAEPITVCCAP